MIRLVAKAHEYYRCLNHVHMRGARDVIDECKPIVADIKRLGHTFDDVHRMFENYNEEPIALIDDPFLTNIKLLFEV